MSSDTTGGAGGPSIEVLAVPSGAGEVLAVGPTGANGVFIVYIREAGLRYLDLSGSQGVWSTAAAGFSASVAGEFGLFFQKLTAEGESTVSVVEAPPRSWACFSLRPASKSTEGKAHLVSRTVLPSDVVAACGLPSDAAAAVALASGQVKFIDMATGQAAGKGLKFDLEGKFSLARLGPGRAVLAKNSTAPGAVAEFFVVEFDFEARRTIVQLRGFAREGAPLMSEPVALSVMGVAFAGEDRVLLCWSSEEPARSGGLVFASAALNAEVTDVVPLPPAERSKGPPPSLWLCTSGYLVELTSSTLSLRDARFGMLAATAAIPFSIGQSKRDSSARILAATDGAVTLMVGQGRLGAVRLTLPRFGLHMLIGRKVLAATNSVNGEQTTASTALEPLREVVTGKRPRDDAAVDEMFGAKRLTKSDDALAAELKSRRWAPSQELVDEIVRRRCWSAAKALLALPELDEAFTIKLLVAQPQFLARVVRRARAPQMLDVALRDHFPASQLATTLEVLLDWLAAYRDFPEAEVQKLCPGMPLLNEVIGFLNALADGCQPALAMLESDLLERVVEAISFVQADVARLERLYAAVRAVYRIRKPLRAVNDIPAIEILHVNF